MKSPFAEAHARLQRRRLLLLGSGLALFVALMLCLSGVAFFDADRYVGFWRNAGRLLGEFFPPDFVRLGFWWQPLWETLAMSVAGTALGFMVALPIACLGTRVVTPWPWLIWPVRLGLNLFRTVPDLIWAVFLVVAVGTGPLAGTFALALHSFGVLGKFFADHMEHTAEEPADAIRATGATRTQVISHGILPQVMPLMMDAVLYRWEVNVRSSLVLGFVGAGGLGAELLNSMAVLAYQEVLALLIMLLLLVSLVDSFSAIIRWRTLQRD